MAKKKLVVSVDEGDGISEVARRLRSEGMTVDQELDAVGIITGEIDESEVDRLRGVEGVTAVEEERTFQLPPPDSDIQ